MTGIVLSGFTAEKAKDLCTFACHVIAASFQVDDGVTLRTVLEVRMERRHAELRPRAPKSHAGVHAPEIPKRRDCCQAS